MTLLQPHYHVSANFEYALAAYPGAYGGDRTGVTPHGAAQAVMNQRPLAGGITLGRRCA